jgi:hypothetical protein
MKSSLMITACLLILVLLTPSFAKANGKDNALAGSRGDEIRKGAVSGSQGRHLNADDSIRDLLAHPAFAGFARLLLPWDGRRYDEAMRLSLARVLRTEGFGEALSCGDARQAEEALELLTQENDTGISARARLRESGVVEYEIGDLREKYGPAGVSVRYGGQLRSREAYRILRPVVATSFRSVRGL